jgi:amidophosphoribosyltransferase
MCGIIGIYNLPQASTLAYLGLYAQQHRGQESAGIVTHDGKRMHVHHAMGHVADIFNQKVLETLPGDQAIGHVRYSTAGESTVKNCQPLTVNYSHGSIAVAHNGNIVNAGIIKKQLVGDGAIFQSTADTEVIIHLLARSRQNDPVARMQEILPQIEGAFSLVFLSKSRMVAARDPSGFRPLVIGKKDDGWVVCSETCALDLIGAEYIREVAPGELVFFEGGEMHSHRFAPARQRKHHCIFEYVYFARPDSVVFDRNVYEIRKGFGRQLALADDVQADMVVPVPDSGVPSAVGYAAESKIPFELGLVRNHYVGRTFIEPEQSIRHFGVKVKINPVKKLMEGKRVILIDDSIVRGTTSQKIVKMVRDAGAKEVHMRISSPPTKWPCFYGIDTPSRRELISSSKSVDEIRDFIKADSLKYLSVESLFWFEKQKPNEWFCDACFTGNYPVAKDIIDDVFQREDKKMMHTEDGGLVVATNV